MRILQRYSRGKDTVIEVEDNFLWFKFKKRYIKLDVSGSILLLKGLDEFNETTFSEYTRVKDLFDIDLL